VQTTNSACLDKPGSQNVAQDTEIGSHFGRREAIQVKQVIFTRVTASILAKDRNKKKWFRSKGVVSYS